MPPNASTRPLSLLGPRTLAPLGSHSSDRGTAEWDPEALGYLFATDEVAYRVLLAPPDEGESLPGLLRLEARLGQGEWVPILTAAGMLMRDTSGAVLQPEETHRRASFQEMRHNLRGRVLALRYEEQVGESVQRRTLQIKLSGKSLEIEVNAPGGAPGEGFAGFSLGPVGPASTETLAVPGLPWPVLGIDGGYLLAYADRLLGRASAYEGATALYRPQAGSTQSVTETYYLTVAPDLLSVLPALRHGPSPFRQELVHRVTLDFYSTQAYEDDERLMRLLPLYGLTDVHLIYRNWQQTGYNRRNPLLYPADDTRGGNETFRQMLQAARDAGWLVSLRQEYFAAAHESPYWAPDVLARDGQGRPRPSCRPGADAIAADRMQEFAKLEATKIARNYPVNGTFVDCHTAWDPEGYLHQVSDAPESSVSTVMQAQRQVEALLAFLRDAHEGPVVGSCGDGEHRWDTLSAGLAEGIIRGMDGGRTAPLLVDYELTEVRPRLVGIGCGSYRQFAGHRELEPVDVSRIDLDAFRATEIALGHAGYAGNYRIKPGPRGIPFPAGSTGALAREYFLLRYLQQLYLDAPVRSIRYRVGDRLLTQDEALAAGTDLAQAQLRVEYEPDLTVWVNRSNERWTVTLNDERFDLPPSGFLAYSAQEQFMAYSVLVNSNRVDYCECPLYTFLDTRGPNPRSVESISTDGGVAFLPGAASTGEQPLPDVVLIGARQAITGENEYRLSERGDARFTWRSTHEIDVTILDTETGKPVHVTFPAPTPEWHQHREVLEYAEGRWQISRTQSHTVRQGIQLARAVPGVTYRLRARG